MSVTIARFIFLLLCNIPLHVKLWYIYIMKYYRANQTVELQLRSSSKNNALCKE